MIITTKSSNKNTTLITIAVLWGVLGFIPALIFSAERHSTTPFLIYLFGLIILIAVKVSNSRDTTKKEYHSYLAKQKEEEKEWGKELQRNRDLLAIHGSERDCCPYCKDKGTYTKGKSLGRELKTTYTKHKKNGQKITMLVYTHEYQCHSCENVWSFETKEEDN